MTAALLLLLAATPPAGGLGEPAPRPLPSVRIQNRYTSKEGRLQMYAGGTYLLRGDFWLSPGLRAGVTYHPIEWLGIELQATRFWSRLDAEAERIRDSTGYIPDSHAPVWLVGAGLRASLGYGKLMLGTGGGRALHFEPQLFAHAGFHLFDGDRGGSGDAGAAFLLYLTPRVFARIDLGATVDVEGRSDGSRPVVGFMPTLVVGGAL